MSHYCYWKTILAEPIRPGYSSMWGFSTWITLVQQARSHWKLKISAILHAHLCSTTNSILRGSLVSFQLGLVQVKKILCFWKCTYYVGRSSINNFTVNQENCLSPSAATTCQIRSLWKILRLNNISCPLCWFCSIWCGISLSMCHY